MKHSIIIPHRDRLAYLALCIWSIRRSAAACGVDDYEVLVVDNGSALRPVDEDHVRAWYDDREMPVFNKPALQNVGIREAKGDVLTFLDADAIVGPFFMDTDFLRTRPDVVRLLYRVRYLPADYLQRLISSGGPAPVLAEIDPSKLKIGYEAYGHHYDDHAPRISPDGPLPEGTPYGNSQFSVTREKLADLRPWEEMAGGGYEDIQFSAQFEARYGARHEARIWTDPEYSILMLKHPVGAWRDPSLSKRNEWLYRDWWQRTTGQVLVSPESRVESPELETL